MHELHCSKNNRLQAQKVETKNNEDKIKSKEQVKVKKSTLEAANEFDEIIEACQKMNNICNYEKCKTQIHVLGQTCKFCNYRFCLQHSLAEIHGCGDKAKQEARAHIRQTGNLNVNAGSRPTSSAAQKIRQEYAEKKIKEKLSQMQSERKPKSKKDSK